MPDFKYEKKLWRRGFKLVGGCDEVGRGSLAGPVVAACVVFSKEISKSLVGRKIKIDDSKKLNVLQRIKAYKWIKKNALAWGVGEGSVFEINKKGISKATNSAFRRAIISIAKKYKFSVEYLLIDAFYIPYIKGLKVGAKNAFKKRYDPEINSGISRQLAIIDGDEKSISISAASIVAKVYRDRIMAKLGSEKRFNKYGWVENKGYGTKKHRKAIIKYGLTQHHRKIFCKNLT